MVFWYFSQGRIIAFDKSAKKISKIEENAASWNLKSIQAYAFDGTKSCLPNAGRSFTCVQGIPISGDSRRGLNKFIWKILVPPLSITMLRNHGMHVLCKKKVRDLFTASYVFQ